MSYDEHIEERILLLAPTPRDTEVTSRILCDARIAFAAFADMTRLLGQLRVGAAAIVLTDHPTHSVDDIVNLHTELAGQPDWSELPVISLVRGDPHAERLRLLRSLPGAVILERPVSTRSFLSAVQAGLRARRRQYELRGQLNQVNIVNRELTRSARAKDEFLATLAHELRNPLGALSNAARILNEAGARSTANQAARNIIDRQIAHMTRLLDNLLDVARITHQRLDLRKKITELSLIVESAVETAQPLLTSKHHELKLELPPRPVRLLVDPMRISQVLSNLLTNAAKYTERGGRIEVDCVVEGGWVVIEVRDNGIGMAPEGLGTIFGMFTQLDTSLGRSDSGLGIGLALARGLVELHGGNITARSDGVGKGSTFSLRLPLADTAGPAVADFSQHSPGSPRNIVVADDNSDSLESLGEILKLQGHRVRLAPNGADALRLLEEEAPDVMLLDIGMPGMNGYELARQVRARYPSQMMTLIALTGWGQPDDKRLAQEAGFDHHLTKPIDLDSLGELLGSA